MLFNRELALLLLSNGQAIVGVANGSPSIVCIEHVRDYCHLHSGWMWEQIRRNLPCWMYVF